MNIYLQIASESFHFAKENHENKEAMKFAEDALAWVYETHCDDVFGINLVNTMIESVEGIYWLSSFSLARTLNGDFPTLLNAVCAAYAFYLEGYDVRSDFSAIHEDDIAELMPLVDAFATKQITVSEKLQKLSHEWTTHNLPF